MNKLIILILISFSFLSLSFMTNAKEYNLICSKVNSDIVLLLNLTDLYDYEGMLVIDREEIPVHLKKGATSRGMTEYKDHNFKSPYKVDFTFDLGTSRADLVIKTQFNQVAFQETGLKCE